MLFIDKNHILISFWFNYVDKVEFALKIFAHERRNYFLIYRFVRAFFHWLLIHQLMMMTKKIIMRLRVMRWAGKFEAFFCIRVIGLILPYNRTIFVWYFMIKNINWAFFNQIFITKFKFLWLLNYKKPLKNRFLAKLT